MGELELPELPKHRMTVDEFFDWWDAHGGDYKYELIDGYVQFKYRDPEAMGRDRVFHNRTKLRAAQALGAAVNRAGLPCEAFVDGLAVRIGSGEIRVPDGLVNCGVIEDDASVANDPVIIFEVVSPTSGQRDATDKFLEYFSVPELQHYLVVYPAKRLVLHHARREIGKIETSFVRDGDITLDPPGMTLSVSEFFEEAA